MRLILFLENYWQIKTTMERVFWILFLLFVSGIIFYLYYAKVAFEEYQKLQAKRIYFSSKPLKSHFENLNFLDSLQREKIIDFTRINQDKNFFILEGRGDLRVIMNWFYQIESSANNFIWDFSLYPKEQKLFFKIVIENRSI